MHFMFDSKIPPSSQTCGLERLHATVGHAACTKGGVAPAHCARWRPNSAASHAHTFSFHLLQRPGEREGNEMVNCVFHAPFTLPHRRSI